MEGNDEKFCQPRVTKKLKKSDEDDDSSFNHQSPEQLDDVGVDQNPFQIQVILDVVFKMLPFEELKKFRFVSSTWSEVGLKEISIRHQKPIIFHDIEELGQDDKLGQLIRLQKSHNLVFPAHHQLFTKFSINIALMWTGDDQMTSPLLDIFLEFFKPSFVQFYGFLKYHQESSDDENSSEEEENIEYHLSHFLGKFLVKIAPTIQEIDLNNFSIQFTNKERGVEFAAVVVNELARTRFPNLRKIINNLDKINLQRMFFYPIIGQNSPKLNNLTFGSGFNFTSGTSENLTDELTELKAKFESSGLMSKLKILNLVDTSSYLIELLADIGQRGLLKLTKLNFEYKIYFEAAWVKEVFVRLIETQGESLRILKASTRQVSTNTDYYRALYYNTIRVPYPRLQNLIILQIDYLSNFQTFFEPINFSIQFPKLEVFRSFDFEDPYYENDYKNFGEGGDMVKFVSFLKERESDDNSFRRNFDKICEIFPNLEFLQVDLDYIPIKYEHEVEENALFWSRLRKLQIHCNDLEDLCSFYLYIRFLKDVKKIEIVVDCGNTLVLEDSYKNPLAKSNGFRVGPQNYDYLRREKLYRRCLNSISEKFSSIIHVTSISIIGYKISEDFKRDFLSIFPDCTFVSRPFKAK